MRKSRATRTHTKMKATNEHQVNDIKATIILDGLTLYHVEHIDREFYDSQILDAKKAGCTHLFSISSGYTLSKRAQKAIAEAGFVPVQVRYRAWGARPVADGSAESEKEGV